MEEDEVNMKKIRKPLITSLVFLIREDEVNMKKIRKPLITSLGFLIHEEDEVQYEEDKETSHYILGFLNSGRRGSLI